jgi:hypothetical protein
MTVNTHKPTDRSPYCAPIAAAAWTALALAVALTGTALAQSGGGNYTLRKQVIAPGGVAAAAGYRIEATSAEPGAGTQSGGGFRLTGGFQTPRPPPDALFADGFEL